jgi:hypothetical protein
VQTDLPGRRGLIAVAVRKKRFPRKHKQFSDGKLYGTTYNGGVDAQGNRAFGVIFSIDAGLPPPK